MFELGGRRPGGKQYVAGYDANGTTCRRTGSSEAARRWLETDSRAHGSTYIDGYEWAVWDYDDASGLRQEPQHGLARTSGTPATT